MLSCQNFLSTLEQINHKEAIAGTLYHYLLSETRSHLESILQQHRQSIEDLEHPSPQASDDLQTVITRYQEQQKIHIQTIEQQLQSIDKQLLGEAAPLLDEAFIREFSVLFHQIQHLFVALSDAPPGIKSLQIELCIAILCKQSPLDQSLQFVHLSTKALEDILQQAILRYKASHDVKYRLQCQRLVHMGYFEWIQRCCKGHESPASLLSQLLGAIPAVKDSDILDTLCDYQAPNGLSILDLLQQHGIHSRFEDIKKTQQTRNLFHRLGFGNEDRREYVRKRQEKLADDLLWARSIRDIEWVSQSKTAVEHFKALADRRYLQTDTNFLYPSKTDELTPQQKKIFKIFSAVKSEREKSKLFSMGSKTNKITTAEMPHAIFCIKTIVAEEIKKPFIQPSGDGDYFFDFVYTNFSDADYQSIVDLIILNGGFGLNAENIVRLIFEDAGLRSKIRAFRLQGPHLADIKKQILDRNLPPPRSHTYLNALTTVDNEVREKQISRIEELGLNEGEELLLRQLLDLHFFFLHYRDLSLDPSLQETFAAFDQGDFINPLKKFGLLLNKVVLTTYQNIVAMDDTKLPPILYPLYEQAKRLALSPSERQALLDRLQDLWQEKTSEESMARRLADLFLEEYQSMTEVLDLSPEDERLKTGITDMAKDFSRLYHRVQQALPLIDADEETSYLAALQSIQQQTTTEAFYHARFKIKHSSTGIQSIVLTFPEGGQQRLELDLGDKPLPYSLLKLPESDEIVLSYGGSRGIVAPFADFDTAYGKKSRFFTRNRLVGAGQYGSVIAVENLLSACHQVLKEGFDTTSEASFSALARNDLRTRAITAYNDGQSSIEYTILQQLAAAKHSKEQVQYWHSEDKPRARGLLYQHDHTPQRYQLRMDRAKGDSLADQGLRQLNRYGKDKLEYHAPEKRSDFSATNLLSLKEILGLAKAVVQTAEAFEDSGFAHNDIKPENIISQHHANQTYSIRFIDWATGGFERQYHGELSEPAAIFKAVFRLDASVHDKQGRYVEQRADGFYYGIHPNLEIVHGARHGTLPYLCPQVIGEEPIQQLALEGQCSSLNTSLKSCDPRMDNWALSAMLFGLCHRKSYFALAKGRSVADYVVPGIIDRDDRDGLKITDPFGFNRFFACRTEDELSAESIASQEAYLHPQALMYIPANAREGEPLHLFRRLQALQALEGIGDSIQPLLDRMHQAMSSQRGMNKKELLSLVAAIEDCIMQYELSHDSEYQAKMRQQQQVSEILTQYQSSPASMDDVLKIVADGANELDILCTQSTPQQEALTLAVLETAITPFELEAVVLDSEGPSHALLSQCITANQPSILVKLITTIDANNPKFIAYVKTHGLLHYALQQGMVETAKAIIDALMRAGATEAELFQIITHSYTPEDVVAAALHWTNSALHICLRQHDLPTLGMLLDHLPEEEAPTEMILQCLHYCAQFALFDCFKFLLSRYNQRYPSDPISAKTILAKTYPPQQSSSYHLLLCSEMGLDAIDWAFLRRDKELAQAFLLQKDYPLLLAIRHRNTKAMQTLLELAELHSFTAKQWQALLSQSDAEEKNLLNHFLEQGRVNELISFLDKLKEKCGSEIVRQMLMDCVQNPVPFHPIKNYLATKPSANQAFMLFQLVLDGLCSDAAINDKKAQLARATVLLANAEWLVQQANDLELQPGLRQLLQNKALNFSLRKTLFTELQEHAGGDSLSAAFYSQLLDEISPAIPEDDIALRRQEKALLLRGLARQERRSTSLLDFFSEAHQKTQADYYTCLRTLEEENKRLQDQLKRGVLPTTKPSSGPYQQQKDEIEAIFFAILSDNSPLLSYCQKTQPQSKAQLLAALTAYKEVLLNEVVALAPEKDHPLRIARALSALNDPTKQQQFAHHLNALKQEINHTQLYPKSKKLGFIVLTLLASLLAAACLILAIPSLGLSFLPLGLSLGLAAGLTASLGILLTPSLALSIKTSQEKGRDLHRLFSTLKEEVPQEECVNNLVP